MSVNDGIRTAREALSARTVYGEPITQDGVTVIPVASVRGGAGGREGEDGTGGGRGFGINARPVGAFLIKDGDVTWKPAIDATRTILGGQTVGAIALLVAWRITVALRRRR